MRNFDYFCSENFSESLLEKIKIMNINEIVGRLKAGGLDASSTNRSAAVYVTEARSGRSEPGWFGFRIICDSEATERRVRSILSRWYDIDASGNVWRLKSKNRVPLMAIKRGGVPPTPPDGPMYFEAVEANSTVSMMSTMATAPNLEYSTDGETWQKWQHTTTTEDEMTIHTFDTLTLTAVGDRVYLRGDNPNGFVDLENEGLSLFSLTGQIAAGGNAQSLVDGDTPTLVAKTMPMFSDFLMTETPSDVLVSTPSLPATTLADYCYSAMFSGCTGLTQAPSLPATTLADYCYSAMFSGCTGLTQAPSLPATTLASYCYSDMFNGCTGLTQAPSLPATTLADHCYSLMFSGCTFEMSSDGSTFNFEFGATPPATVGAETYNTYYDIAQWMGNTNGFTNL